jgi:medium-chain acyl-[acyl-carrier-protein] hydrolase
LFAGRDTRIYFVFYMTNLPPIGPWLPFGAGPENAGVRMFCLPFAGGGASNFAGWRNRFPGVGVAPLQYPGHETRIDESPLQDIGQMIEGLADAIVPLLDRPYILFGYSMGARLAFALTRRLASRGLPMPMLLMVAANVPPNRTSGVVHAAGLPDAAFKKVVREFGGVPEDLLDDEDFCAMALPILRADFSLASQELKLGRVDCPIIAYAGSADSTAAPKVMAGWGCFTNAAFQLREFAGGHFFLRSASEFEAAVASDLASARQLRCHANPITA